MPLARPYVALFLIRADVRIAEIIAGHVVVGSAITELTDAVPAQRITWRRAAIAAPSPARSPKTREWVTSWPRRSRGESETYAKPAWAESKVNT